MGPRRSSRAFHSKRAKTCYFQAVFSCRAIGGHSRLANRSQSKLAQAGADCTISAHGRGRVEQIVNAISESPFITWVMSLYQPQRKTAPFTGAIY